LINKERQDFMKYIQNYYENADEDYEFMNPEAVQYVNDMITHLKNVPINYDKLYQKHFDFEPTHADYGNFKRANFDMQNNILQLVNMILAFI
jgi:hypothetical protein